MEILDFNLEKERLIIKENGKKKKYTAWLAWQTKDRKYAFYECNPYFLNIFSKSDDHGFAQLFAVVGVSQYLSGHFKKHPFKCEDKKTKILAVSEDGTMLFGDEAIEFFDALIIIEKMAKA